MTEGVLAVAIVAGLVGFVLGCWAAWSLAARETAAKALSATCRERNRITRGLLGASEVYRRKGNPEAARWFLRAGVRVERDEFSEGGGRG